MNINRALENFFSEYGIEYFAALDWRDVRTSNPRILDRSGISPRSVIVFLIPYYASDTVNISRYAAARDYHIVIREITERLTSLTSELFPGSHSKGYGDHSPIDERHAALIASLGVAGDNGLLINEKYGSYVFIADVITDIPPDSLGATTPSEIHRCIGCGACRKACPTGILRGDGDECLSAITQKKGELTDSQKALMREYNTAWGCDICQSVCPYNASPKITPVTFFREQRIEKLTREALASMTDAEFSERAFAWRGRATVARNLEILEDPSA